jgi:hypothetical protein
MELPDPSEILFSLKLARRRHVETLLLTEDRLIEEGSFGKRRWRRSWRLQDLSPELDYTTGRPEHSELRVVAGLVLIALALVFYFSTFQVHVPLLAPLVAVLGGWLLVRGLKGWRLETWTLIRKSDGSTATHFAHSFGGAEDRRDFETRLIEQIRRQHRLGA